MSWFFTYADFAAFAALVFTSQEIGRQYPQSWKATLVQLAILPVVLMFGWNFFSRIFAGF